MLADPSGSGRRCRRRSANGWRSQAERSAIPDAGEVLVETFPRGNRHFLVVYPFEGRLAHQTLGMLLTRRLDRWARVPLGFVANDYALAMWGIGDMAELMERAGRLDLAELCSPRTCWATTSMPGSPNRA